MVAAASGAVGSVVGQLAKIKGCRAVGIAGGKDKCDYVVRELGFDACLDHRDPQLRRRLQRCHAEAASTSTSRTWAARSSTWCSRASTRSRAFRCAGSSRSTTRRSHTA